MLSEEELEDLLSVVIEDTTIASERLRQYIKDLRTELSNLKEIEKSHQEENGKLRVELEQEKNKINTIKQLMSIGDVTDEALFTLAQITMTELERLEDVEEKYDILKEDYNNINNQNIKLIEELEQEKEKNKKLEEYQKQYLDGELITAKQGKFFEKMIKENYIRKDKIKKYNVN